MSNYVRLRFSFSADRWREVEGVPPGTKKTLQNTVANPRRRRWVKQSVVGVARACQTVGVAVELPGNQRKAQQRSTTLHGDRSKTHSTGRSQTCRKSRGNNSVHRRGKDTSYHNCLNGVSSAR